MGLERADPVGSNQLRKPFSKMDFFSNFFEFGHLRPLSKKFELADRPPYVEALFTLVPNMYSVLTSDPVKAMI
jgi:hypothetical protein